MIENGLLRCFAVKRPGLYEFLRSAKEDYNICLFTSSKRKVTVSVEGNDVTIDISQSAITVAQAIDIIPFLFEIYGRDDCQKLSSTLYVKNITTLGFSLRKTIFVDVTRSFYLLEKLIQQRTMQFR